MVAGTKLPLIQTPKASFTPPLTYSGYSSDVNTNCIVSISPVGMKLAFRIAPSKVAMPATAFNCPSPFIPPSGSLVRPATVLVSVVPEELVKSVTLPVDRMTPVSVGTMPAIVLSAPL